MSHSHAHEHEHERSSDSEDIFDAAINLEADLIDAGYEEGLADGDKEGVAQGKAIGFLKGREIGRELGYIDACVALLIARGEAQPDRYLPRLIKSAQTVRELIAAFKYDAKNENFGEELDRIRGKWRLLSSQTDLKELHQATPRNTLSF